MADLYVADQQLEMILVLAWILFKWFRLHTEPSHKHSKIIVSMTWLSRCDLFIWSSCPSLSLRPPKHTFAHSFAYTHTLTTTPYNKWHNLFSKNANSLNVGKYVVVFSHPSPKQCAQCHTALDSTGRQTDAKACSGIRFRIVEISMSLSSIVVVVIITIITSTKCYPNLILFSLQQHILFSILQVFSCQLSLQMSGCNNPPETFCCCI